MTTPKRLPASPLSFAQREEHYLAENRGRALTPRQKRRLTRKSRHAQSPLLAAIQESR